MKRKSIKVTEEAYLAIRSLKREGESFNKLFDRLGEQFYTNASKQIGRSECLRITQVHQRVRELQREWDQKHSHNI